MNIAEKYIDDVMDGRIVVGRYMRKAVERHVEDLKTAGERGYYFDAKWAKKVIDFFPILPFAKGVNKGKPFKLQPWQAFIVWVVYGWKKKKDGFRRFDKVYIKVARKNGKTEYMAAIGTIALTLDWKPGTEVYWAATKKEQAKIGWKRQKIMTDLLISRSRSFSKRFKTNQVRIFHKNDDTFCAYLGKDSNTEDGLYPRYAIIDEYHAHKDASMVEVLESGMGAWDEPLTWIITTAGFNKDSACKGLEDTCKKILDGILENDNIAAFIFDLDVKEAVEDEEDKGDDLEDFDNWVKANPGMGISPKIDRLISAFKKAKTEAGTSWTNFITKNLNIWTSTVIKWITDDQWKACYEAFDSNLLEGRECFGGLDLAATADICSLVLFFPANEDDPKHRILPFFYCPEQMVEDEETKNYLRWQKQGFLTVTSGNVTDYAYIKRDILQCAERFNIRSIAFDRYNSSQIVIELIDEGLEFSQFGQGVVSMSTPTKNIRHAILGSKLAQNGNPVMRWMMSNAQVKKDAHDNHKLVKGDGKKTFKVDGPVAMVMSFGEYLTYLADDTNKPSKYETEDLTIF